MGLESSITEENKKQASNIKNTIINRVAEPIEKSQEDLLQVSIYIQQLNNFIDGQIELSENKIYIMLKWLSSNFCLNLIYLLEENIVFLRRARKFEERSSSSYCFTELQDLLFVPEEKKDMVDIGRMNKAKTPMYYGVISHSYFNKFDTALSEIDAKELDYINILDSKLKKSIKSLYIGGFDLFIKGKEIHTWVHPYYQEAYQMLSDKCKEKNNDFLLKSYSLCSAFFADTLSRKKHGRLYEVTSTLSSILFETTHLDSIIYESVQIEGTPVIVIKPSVVTKALEHETVISFKILSNLGYGIYYGEQVNRGKVVNNQLEWEHA